MRRLQRLRDLARDAQGLVNGKATARRLAGLQASGCRLRALDDFCEGRALDELEDHGTSAVVGFFQSVDRADARVVERREDLGFSLESRQPVWIGGERLRHDLQRHVAVQLGVPRSIHLAHAALTNLGDDLIRAQAGAGFERHR